MVLMLRTVNTAITFTVWLAWLFHPNEIFISTTLKISVVQVRNIFQNAKSNSKIHFKYTFYVLPINILWDNLFLQIYACFCICFATLTYALLSLRKHVQKNRRIGLFGHLQNINVESVSINIIYTMSSCIIEASLLS